ncbi:MAG: metal ABC transporter permease, partial [Clostridia bacterium]|nr:metal ABC transporter permease [Clostridia bacterium]
MRNALFAVLLIMPLFAVMGTMIVNNGMSFFSDALGHSALTGVGIGVILGMSDHSLPMIVFAVVFALLMNRIRHSGLGRTDTIIGVFSSCGVALGLVLLSGSGNFQNYQSLLIGDILNVTADQLWVLAAA